MSASGAGVLQLRSVEYARNHGVRIHCRSSFEDGPGTVVVSEEETMEHPLVTAVTHSTAETRITLLGVPDQPGIAGRIFRALADANVQRRHDHPERAAARTAAAPTCRSRSPREDGRIAREALDAIVGELGIEQVAAEESMGKVSIVGAGMRSHPGVAATVFTVLGDAGINIEMISTSPIKISCVIAGDRVPEAVRGLHAAFGLAGEDTIVAEDPFGDAAMSAAPRVAVVGATGAVGRIMLEVLAARRFAASEIVPFASRALGRARARRRRRRSRPLRDETIAGFDLALFSAGGATSREWAPRFAAAGAIVVDNSSAWRMDPRVPLVVSEVNPARARAASRPASSPTRTARR